MNLVGKKFGKLTVLEFLGKTGHNNYWLCECECGTKKRVSEYKLTSGLTKSCGCYRKDLLSRRNKKHGLKNQNPRLYRIWLSMRNRCNNPNATKYFRYGARGIRICDEWNDYSNFYGWAIGNGYSSDLSIDRKDNDGNYTPENCQWTSSKEQARNRSTNRFLAVNGITKLIVEWAEITGLSDSTIRKRLSQGFSPEEAIKVNYGSLN